MNVGLRLVSGEILIGEHVNTTSESLQLKNVAQLVVHDAGDGRVGVGMQPFIPFGKENVTIGYTHVLATFTPEDQIDREYNRLYGTGLLLPETKLVDPYALRH